MRTILNITLMLVCAAPAAAEPASRSDKDQVLAWAKGFFSDPYSLRSTEISDRTLVNGVEVICVGFNGKNAYGAYTGIHRTPFEVRGAQLVHASRSYAVNTDTCRAPEIRMRPFPELSAIR